MINVQVLRELERQAGMIHRRLGWLSEAVANEKKYLLAIGIKEEHESVGKLMVRLSQLASEVERSAAGGE